MKLGQQIEAVYRGEQVRGVITEIAGTFVVVTDALGREYYVSVEHIKQ
jgi:hypothetical protein